MSGDDEERPCGEPCHPTVSCGECDAYWERMISEGFWDAQQNVWTEKGMKEFVRGGVRWPSPGGLP